MDKEREKRENRIQKVIKLGGSCLNDSASIRKAVSLLKKDPLKIAVVISALKGVTNLLLDAYYAALDQSRDFRGLVASIRKRHDQIALELLSTPFINELEKKFQEIFDRLNEDLDQIFRNRETSSSLKARILSLGERLSAYLLSTCLEAEGIKTKVYETDRIGLIASEKLGRVKVNLKKFEANFRKVKGEIETGDVLPIFTGFFGSDERGEVILFGRNGSDYSAAVLARGFRAKILELYKDVPGVFSADPALIPESRLIPSLSREEVAKLSLYGAKIIHPSFWHPLEGLNIEVRVKGIDLPESTGTIITRGRNDIPKEQRANKGQEITSSIKGFSIKENVVLLKIESFSLAERRRNFSRIEKALAERGGEIVVSFSQNQGLALVLGGLSAESIAKISHFLVKPTKQKLSVEANLALIAVVGEGIGESKALIFWVLEALIREKIFPVFVVAGLENSSILILVKGEASLQTLKTLHAKFFYDESLARGIVPDAHLLVG